MSVGLPGFGFYSVYRHPGLLDLELQCGAEWTYPRLGQNAWNDAGESWLTECQAKFPGKVAAWMFVDPHPQQMSSALSAIRRVFASGLINALVLDPEDSWSGVDYKLARMYATEVRSYAPGMVVGYCPVDTVAYRAGKLDATYGAFSEVFDFCDPQYYAWEHGDQGLDYWLAIAERQWTDLESRYPGARNAVRRGVMCSYRPRTRGLAAVSPMTDDLRARLVADVRRFRVLYPDGPLFTSDSMDAAVAAALTEDAKHDTEPPGTDWHPAEAVDVLPTIFGATDDTPTAPGTPTSKSSQRIPAVNAPIIDSNRGGSS